MAPPLAPVAVAVAIVPAATRLRQQPVSATSASAGGRRRGLVTGAAAAGPQGRRRSAVTSVGTGRVVVCSADASGAAEKRGRLLEAEKGHLLRAAELAVRSAGETAPHPNAGCVLLDVAGGVVAEGALIGQGGVCAEAQAAAAAAGRAAGGCALLNLEPAHGELAGDDSAVRALLAAKVGRVVIGLRHPLSHLRGKAIRALREAGVRVEVLGDAFGETSGGAAAAAAVAACQRANAALLHLAATGRPYSILKYAMTLDGKIATAAGHAAWVTSPAARARVFRQRALSDAVLVGGQTVRRDDPQLTTRQEGGHAPARVVLSRSMNLPDAARLWDVSSAPTIVMTQRGARREFQAALRARGVEVVEFDFLTPGAVMDYCAARGFLQCLWECGGTLSAPAIADGAIHALMAFVAPKLIGGGDGAPSPVGELGFVEMTQAIDLIDTRLEVVGPDVLITGYLPASGGLGAVAARAAGAAAAARATDLRSAATAAARPAERGAPQLLGATPGTGASGRAPAADAAGAGPSASAGAGGVDADSGLCAPPLKFYKAWGAYGALSNFSPHAIELEDAPGPGPAAASGGPRSPVRVWPSVEHYYQAQKFDRAQTMGRAAAEEVAAAPTAELAARIGRRLERQQPGLVRRDWAAAKVSVMAAALRAKFAAHAAPRALLLGTADVPLEEASPHDLFWGSGYDGTGSNTLGHLLGDVRAELLAACGSPCLEAEAVRRELEAAGRLPGGPADGGAAGGCAV